MKSIMQDKSEGICYLCAKLHYDYFRREGLEEHHVIYGKGNRKLSEKYGLKVYLCHEHHNDINCPESVHFNRSIREYLCRDAQRAFNKKYKNMDFAKIFGVNYLQEDKENKVDKPDPAAGFILLEDVKEGDKNVGAKNTLGGMGDY